MDVGRTLVSIDDLLARVRDLLTIGTALNSASWGDDLTTIKGIGPAYQAALIDNDITTFADLAQIDAMTRRRVINSVESAAPDVDAWIRQAAGLASSATVDIAADHYLETVGFCIGRWYDGSGLVGFVVRNDRGQAVPWVVDLFDAPPEHKRSVALAAALRDVVVDRGGHGYVPIVDPTDLHNLRLIERSLREHESLTADLVELLEYTGDRTRFDFTGTARAEYA